MFSIAVFAKAPQYQLCHLQFVPPPVFVHDYTSDNGVILEDTVVKLPPTEGDLIQVIRHALPGYGILTWVGLYRPLVRPQYPPRGALFYGAGVWTFPQPGKGEMLLRALSNLVNHLERVIPQVANTEWSISTFEPAVTAVYNQVSAKFPVTDMDGGDDDVIGGKSAFVDLSKGGQSAALLDTIFSGKRYRSYSRLLFSETPLVVEAARQGRLPVVQESELVDDVPQPMVDSSLIQPKVTLSLSVDQLARDKRSKDSESHVGDSGALAERLHALEQSIPTEFRSYESRLRGFELRLTRVEQELRNGPMSFQMPKLELAEAPLADGKGEQSVPNASHVNFPFHQNSAMAPMNVWRSFFPKATFGIALGLAALAALTGLAWNADTSQWMSTLSNQIKPVSEGASTAGVPLGPAVVVSEPQNAESSSLVVRKRADNVLIVEASLRGIAARLATAQGRLTPRNGWSDNNAVLEELSIDAKDFRKYADDLERAVAELKESAARNSRK